MFEALLKNCLKNELYKSKRTKLNTIEVIFIFVGIIAFLIFLLGTFVYPNNNFYPISCFIIYFCILIISICESIISSKVKISENDKIKNQIIAIIYEYSKLNECFAGVSPLLNVSFPRLIEEGEEIIKNKENLKLLSDISIKFVLPLASVVLTQLINRTATLDIIAMLFTFIFAYITFICVKAVFSLFIYTYDPKQWKTFLRLLKHIEKCSEKNKIMTIENPVS
jgi:hypothetical protein